jgi:hypothetical protein
MRPRSQGHVLGGAGHPGWQGGGQENNNRKNDLAKVAHNS